MDSQNAMQLEKTEDTNASPRQDTAKYRQILNGARDVFLSHGYDGASMDMIAKTAGVSKGTLYVYFSNKEALFRELILSVRSKQAEALLGCTNIEGDLRALLTKIGREFVAHMLDPDKISTIRMVLGATEKFPEFGELLYEAGPKKGIQSLGAFLDGQIEKGTLTCPDTELAAAQFMDLCISRFAKRVLFRPKEMPTQKEITANVDSAVHMFLAAYGTGK